MGCVAQVARGRSHLDRLWRRGRVSPRVETSRPAEDSGGDRTVGGRSRRRGWVKRLPALPRAVRGHVRAWAHVSSALSSGASLSGALAASADLGLLPDWETAGRLGADKLVLAASRAGLCVKAPVAHESLQDNLVAVVLQAPPRRTG